MRKINARSYRPAPLGLRRPGSDELFGGPFSPGRRSERYRPKMCEKVTIKLLRCEWKMNIEIK
jgi:hypothetical protein